MLPLEERSPDERIHVCTLPSKAVGGGTPRGERLKRP